MSGFAFCEQVLLPRGTMRKIFSKSARRISACLRAFRPPAAGFKQNKSPPAHHRPRNDPVTSRLTSLADARTMGRQMGFPGHSHAWRAVILACGLVWFGPAPDASAGTLMTPGVSELIRKSAEPFGLFASPLSAGGVRGKMAAASSASSTTKGCSWRCATATASAAPHRPRCNSSPSSTSAGRATAAPASARSIARSILRSGR